MPHYADEWKEYIGEARERASYAGADDSWAGYDRAQLIHRYDTVMARLAMMQLDIYELTAGSVDRNNLQKAHDFIKDAMTANGISFNMTQLPIVEKPAH